MSTTSSVNAGLANLLQNLSNIGSPLLSSPKVLAALQNAPPADIVQLSDEAIQLEGLNALFGASEASGTAASSNSASLLSSLFSGNGSPATPSGPDVTSLLQEFGSASPATVSALQNATAGDIVQLSAEAAQQAGLSQLLGQPSDL